MTDKQLLELSQHESKLLVQDIANKLFESFKISQKEFKLLTENELNDLYYIREILKNDLAWVILISSVGSVKKFESINSEFKNMDIDAYMKKINTLKKKADELSIYSDTPITLKFPIHPLNHAISFKQALERFCGNEETQELCWKIFSEMTGIKQVRKTAKYLKFMDSYDFEERESIIQSFYYHYTT
ncbi:MAG: hypothetical protein CJD30_11530, partial [Sulfuricurvum sp. PD_MW2]|uniref:hypothetical protein n=1 Tax=Sulfuricurvum sp. PD_MW2 TaxID=2027917 RepID=UPI000C060899